MTLGPPPVPIYRCPKCKASSCTPATGGMIMCTNCYAMWPNKMDFDLDVMGKSISAPASIDFAEFLEDNEPSEAESYISSGEMQEDIEKLVAQAVADKMLNSSDKLAYDVRRIYQATSNPEVRLRAIVDLVDRYRDEAQMEWAEVADGDDN